MKIKKLKLPLALTVALIAAFGFGIYEGAKGSAQDTIEPSIVYQSGSLAGDDALLAKLVDAVPTKYAIFLLMLGLIPGVWLLLGWIPTVPSQTALAFAFLLAGAMGMGVLITRL